jgi:hypothetical protein
VSEPLVLSQEKLSQENLSKILLSTETASIKQLGREIMRGRN